MTVRLVPARYCGAKTRPGAKFATCRRPAGWATPHQGQGRCKLHGGLNPIKSGRYSTLRHETLRDLIAKHEADPDPLNVLPELAAARALFEDFIQRHGVFFDALLAWHKSFRADPETSVAKPAQVLDISDAYRLVTEITRISYRLEKIRLADAISRSDLLRVMVEFGRVVEAFVADPKVLEKIKAGWLAVRIA